MEDDVLNLATQFSRCNVIVPTLNHQEDSAARLPPPLPPSGEALKDPPKEVALLQDEETLFLDEDTLPAEVRWHGASA